MSNFILILILGGILLKPKTAFAGKGDAPTFQQIAPESTMTEAAKAMQEGLTKIGKAGYEQGMKYLDPAIADNSKAFYQSALNALQNGTVATPSGRYATATPSTNSTATVPVTTTPTVATTPAATGLDQLLNDTLAGKTGQRGIVDMNTPLDQQLQSMVVSTYQTNGGEKTYGPLDFTKIPISYLKQKLQEKQIQTGNNKFDLNYQGNM